VPWFGALARPGGSLRAVLLGWALSFVIGLSSGWWVAPATRAFLELSWPASIAMLLVFAATCAQPHLLLAAPLIRWGARRLERGASVSHSVMICLCLALLYTALDALVPRLFDAGLGYALHSAPRMRQLADLGGVSLLTFSIVLGNLLVWRAWVAVRARPVQRTMILAHVVLAAAGWSAAALYGGARNRANARALEASERALQVGVIQGNVANDVRLAWARGDDRAAEKQLAAYMLPTEELAGDSPQPELIVWPEAAYPAVFQQPRSTFQRGRANKFDRQVLRLNRPIAFGAYDLETVNGERALYNSLFVITPRYDNPGSMGTVQRYHKHELLPFAETIPGVSQNAWFRRHLPSLGFFRSGEGPGGFEITTPRGEHVALGPIICSESLSAQHVLATARRGADILLNVGSDGWFGRFGEPQFHLAVARIRSVETRLPQVRAANTGISALILPGGEIAARSVLGVETALNINVPLTVAGESLIMRWGDWFGGASLASGLLLAVFLMARRSAGTDLAR
jgi:apolipoprotein N-acyltransferase